jgi:hypothetical protein
MFYFGSLGQNQNADPDSDGFTNGQEYSDDSNPTNALSHPWNISGTIYYSGPQTGTIHVVASATVGNWTTVDSVTLTNTGAYTITNLPPNLNYTVLAWRDSTGGGTNVFWFAQGSFTNSVYLNTNAVNVNIPLFDPDTDGDGLPDWWEVKYGLDPLNPVTPDVAWWKLDETSGTTAQDSTGNGNTGSFSNLSTSAWTSGVYSNALTFNGTGFLQATDSPSLEPYYVSIELWVKPSQTLTTNNSAVFFSKKLASGTTGYQLSYQQGALNFTFCSAGTNTLAWPCTLTNGVWYHLAGTYDGNWQRIYVNGMICTNKNYSWGTSAYGYIDQGNVVARLGATPDAVPTNFFAGIMDDVRIYGYGLASNEVYGAYQVGADSDGDGLSNWQEYQLGTDPDNPDTTRPSVVISSPPQNYRTTWLP